MEISGNVLEIVFIHYLPTHCQYFLKIKFPINAHYHEPSRIRPFVRVLRLEFCVPRLITCALMQKACMRKTRHEQKYHAKWRLTAVSRCQGEPTPNRDLLKENLMPCLNPVRPPFSWVYIGLWIDKTSLLINLQEVAEPWRLHGKHSCFLRGDNEVSSCC